MDVAEAQKSPQSHRSRAVQSLVRKQQLIGSTIECIDQFGLSQTTIAKIAQHAGVSQGVVIFHFQTKELLLEQVLRFLSKEYTHNWKSAIAVAGEAPIDQLCAIVMSAFSTTVCIERIWESGMHFGVHHNPGRRIRRFVGKQTMSFQQRCSVCAPSYVRA